MNDDRKESDENNGLRRWDKWALGLLGLGMLLLAAPWLLTKSAWHEALDFTKTGQIGDTIGGITAPFMSLVGSGLVYLSFRMQVEMNRIQFKAINKQFKRNNDEDKEARFGKLLDLIMVYKENYSERYIGLFSNTSKKESITYTLNSLLNTLSMRSNNNLLTTQLSSEIVRLNLKYSFISSLLDLHRRIEIADITENDMSIIKVQLELFYSDVEAYSGVHRWMAYIDRIDSRLTNETDKSIIEIITKLQKARDQILSTSEYFNPNS
ncbi:hypothetical protein KDU71_07590 [Carboxylicivirga sediminis]|uniref:Uncharacterized protein n=1 Tax=Carboxylicivirga sediminis TaxID=2006564 RepID=A0A941F339_9BACT|nr:hypothetical protein [Carboxylicivirga sediminis]MBR8535419.1 hypothetical protein [Carboxylicivirga sediminis]